MLQCTLTADQVVRFACLQAGTLSGNPLAMTAGLKTLEILDRPGSYEHLDKITGKLIDGILKAGRDAGHAVSGGHISGQCASFTPSLTDVFDANHNVVYCLSKLNRVHLNFSAACCELCCVSRCLQSC